MGWLDPYPNMAGAIPTYEGCVTLYLESIPSLLPLHCLSLLIGDAFAPTSPPLLLSTFPTIEPVAAKAFP